MKYIILLYVLIFIGCGQAPTGSSNPYDNLEITTCTKWINPDACGGMNSCDIWVRVQNSNNTIVKNVVVQVKVPNIYGAIVYTTDVIIGSIEKNSSKSIFKTTPYIFLNVAEFQCSFK